MEPFLEVGYQMDHAFLMFSSGKHILNCTIYVLPCIIANSEPLWSAGGMFQPFHEPQPII
jgi:hypothetical protein